MTPDIASLMIKIDATQADAGATSLDKLTSAGGKAEASVTSLGRASSASLGGLQGIPASLQAIDARTDALRASVDPLAMAMKRTNAEMHEASALYKAGAIGAAEYGRYVDVLENRLASAVAAQNMMNAAQAKGAKSIGLTASESLNLSRQMADVGVSMAMGMSPLMVMIQQGPQIADIFGQASARGVGFSGVLRGMVAAAGPLLPVLLGIAAAAAALAGVTALTANQLNKAGESADELQKRLGLTDEQMKKVKNTSVTMGDVIAGSAKWAADSLMKMFGPALKVVGDFFQWTFDGIAKIVLGAGKVMTGTWLGGFEAIKATWYLLPAVMGDAAISAANLVVRAVEAMINKAIGAINLVIGFANQAAGAMGLAFKLPTLDELNIGRFENAFAGSMQAAGKAGAEGFARGMQNGRALADQTLADWQAAILAARDARVVKEGGKAKDPKSRMSEAERDFKRAIENATEMVATIKAETAARQSLNDQVARGAITFAEANRALELQAKLQPLIIEASKVEGEQRKKLIGLIEQITKAQAALNAEEMRGQMLKASEDRAPQIEMLRKELSLIGETARARALALAVLKEEQKWRERGVVAGNLSGDSLAAYQAAIASAGELASLQVDIQDAQSAYNYELGRTASLLADIDAQTRTAGAGLIDAFDGASDSVGGLARGISGLLTAYTGLAAKEAQIARERKDWQDSGLTGTQKYRDFEVKAARDSATARIDAYSSMASAGQQFFEEGSAGYRMMQVAMIAFRTVETLMSIQAMAQKGGEVAATVAAEGTKSSAYGITAYAKTLASLPFPFNLAAGATVLASLAAVGVAMSGGGGGGGSSGPSISERRQSSQGTGSVLGDTSAVSESIANSLALVAENTNRDLEYSNGMLRALRSIDDQIGAVAAALARSLGAGGALDTSRLKLGTSGTTPSLSNLGFSSSTTKKLVDQGVQFVGQTVADIIAGGIEAATYNVVKSTSKSTAFGITLSSSSKTKTSTAALEADLQSQLTLLVGSLRDGVLSAASILGVDGAQATLDAFALNIGKISLAGMTGAEIEEAISAVFGKVADDMAGAVIPGLTALQNVGEGLFETLTRVARQYQVVDTSLKAIGMTFGATGVASLAARERLVDLFGSLDEFADQTAFFAENFLTEAERLAPIQSAVTAELTRLGLAGVTTRDQFKTVVQGLDLSTAAGASLFAALMSVAPAFDKVATASEEAAERLADAQARLAELQLEAADRATEAAISALDAISSAAGETSRAADSALQAAVSATADARQTLVTAYERERKALLDVVGGVDTARATLSSAYEREASALRSVSDKFGGFAKGLRAFRDELAAGDAAILGPVETLRRRQASFRAIAGSRTDEALGGGIESSGRAYLDAALAGARTSREYQRAVAEVMRAVSVAEVAAKRQADVPTRQLAALDASVRGLLAANDNLISVRQAIAGLRSAQSAAADAQAQLAALDETAAGLGIVNTSVVGVQQAIADLLAAQQAQSVAQATADAATAAYQSASLAAQQAQLAYDADRAAREASAFAAQLAAAQGAVSAAQAAMAPASVVQSPDAPANAPTPTSAAPVSTNDNTELVAELRALRAEMTAMKAEQVKTNTNTRKMSDLWVRVTRDGEALLTEVA